MRLERYHAIQATKMSLYLMYSGEFDSVEMFWILSTSVYILKLMYCPLIGLASGYS